MSDNVSMDEGIKLDPNGESFYDDLAKIFCESGGVGLGDIVGVGKDEREQLYAFATMLYEGGRYSESRDVLSYLSRLEPSDSRFVKSLGMACQMGKSYDDAVTAYGTAALFDIEDPEPSIYAAECLLHLGEIGRARAAVRGAELQAALRPLSDDLQDKLKALRDALRQYDTSHQNTAKEDRSAKDTSAK